MKTIRHIGIVVKDLAKALDFYRDLLGFKVIKQMEETGDYIDTICGIKNISVTTVKLAANDGNLIELLCFHSPSAVMDNAKKINSAGFSHISCGVEDVDSEYQRLKGKGIQFISLPKASPDGYAKVAFCSDPEGNLIELVEVLQGR